MTVLRSYILIIFVSTSVLFAQQREDRRYNAFSGSMVLNIEGASTIAETDYTGVKPDYLGKASLEYFIPSYSKSSFGFRLFGGGGFLSGEDKKLVPNSFRTKLSFGGAGVVYALSINDEVFPYLFAGASYLWYSPYGETTKKLQTNTQTEVDYNGELGIRILLADNLSFNINGGAQISPNDNLDHLVRGNSNDLFYYAGIGFSFSFFADVDSDHDGVPDSRDMCPGTPEGVAVDATGCPLDSDGDGVPDYLDKCPNTPKGVKVDANGCPLDSDGDGVPDYRDICPNTPHGVKVDDLGCPLDSDGDGVPDYKDKCPNTPANVAVDSTGCPLDSDHDGVPDYLDKCPNTPRGVKVDSTGCPIESKSAGKNEAEESNQMVLSSQTSFALGRTQLLPYAYKELDKIVKVIENNPDSKWRIVGYTDNTGSAKMNKYISLERANAVLHFFLSQGLTRDRFEVIGMGEENPIASNNTEEGRSKNRRVEIIRIK
jgi:OmpA-OmpF porin, OOP family